MRVTQSILYDNFLFYLNKDKSELQKVYSKISSGKKLLKSSDDPFAALKALEHKSDLAVKSQHLRNLEGVREWQSASESALRAIENTLLKLKEIAISQGSDSATTSTRVIFAPQVEQLRKQLLSLFNSRLGNRYLFAGSQVTNPPYRDDGTYVGNDEDLEVDVGLSRTVSYNVKGSVFSSGDNIVQMVAQLRDALQNNDVTTIRNMIDRLSDAYQRVTSEHSRLGLKMEMMEHVKEGIRRGEIEVQGRLSEIEDAELSNEAARLAMMQTVYQSTLAGMTKVLQTNIFSFLG